jgi:hypothetical protein
MFSTDFSKREINTKRGMIVINLIEEMHQRWPAGLGPFPGDPYNTTLFASSIQITTRFCLL